MRRCGRRRTRVHGARLGSSACGCRTATCHRSSWEERPISNRARRRRMERASQCRPLRPPSSRFPRPSTSHRATSRPRMKRTQPNCHRPTHPTETIPRTGGLGARRLGGRGLGGPASARLERRPAPGPHRRSEAGLRGEGSRRSRDRRPGGARRRRPRKARGSPTPTSGARIETGSRGRCEDRPPPCRSRPAHRRGTTDPRPNRPEAGMRPRSLGRWGARSA